MAEVKLTKLARSPCGARERLQCGHKRTDEQRSLPATGVSTSAGTLYQYNLAAAKEEDRRHCCHRQKRRKIYSHFNEVPDSFPHVPFHRAII
jgi:hypothetical protein